jgi:hypothetical protein
MKGRRSAGLANGATLAALFLFAFLLCGCAGVEKDAIQGDVSSIPVTTIEYSKASSSTAAPVSSIPREETVISSAGTLATIPEEPTETKAACKADCDSRYPQLMELCQRAYANSCRDASICGEIPPGDNRDGCYYDLAVKTEDHLLCDMAQGNNTRLLCKAGFEKNSSICREITNADMQCDCYLNILAPTTNMSECENVFPTACKGRCFYRYAVKYDLPQLCQRTDDGSRDSCYVSVGTQNLDPAACAGLQTPSRDLCFLDMAVGLMDLQICDNLTYSEKGYKYWCLAAAERNVSLCDRVGNEKWPDCVYYVARLTGDGSICEKTNDKTGSCYIALAEYGKDPLYCENIKGPEEKDRCYASSAAARSEISLCRNVTSQNYKKECYGSFIQGNTKEMLLGGKTRIFS